MKHRTPKTIEQGKALLERYAALASKARLVTSVRDAVISDANQLADAELLPISQEQSAIAELLGPWWTTHKAALTGGKRKSAELGGCMIGTKSSAASLDFTGEDADKDRALLALREARWGKPFVRVSYAFDRAAIKSGLDGTHGDKLRGLGFAMRAGVDALFVTAVAQSGSVDAAAA